MQQRNRLVVLLVLFDDARSLPRLLTAPRVREATPQLGRTLSPFVALGEAGTFWTSQTLPAIQLSPISVSFGAVFAGDSADRTVTITNTGHADLVITIPAPAGNIFTWVPVSGHAIAPGASFATEVDFSPPGVGQANGRLRVESNAAGSPHIVTLTGSGKKGNA